MTEKTNDIFVPDSSLALPEEFYRKETAIVARRMIGKVLVRIDKDEIFAGEIVETEAYIPEGDEANHAARGKTKRNQVMFEQGGKLYVYLIYGMYYCINAVTENENVGSAVLIRAVRPLTGIEKMKMRRNKSKLQQLCSGPGKLASAFGFDKSDNGRSLNSENLFIQEYKSYPESKIIACSRVGIKKSADLPFRFLLKDSKFVSPARQEFSL